MNKRPSNVHTIDACDKLSSDSAVSIKISPSIQSAMVNAIEHFILFMFCIFILDGFYIFVSCKCSFYAIFDMFCECLGDCRWETANS